MEQELLNAIATSIQSSVRETVNGKIDKLTSRLETHIDKHEDELIQLVKIKTDMKWHRWLLVGMAGGVGLIALHSLGVIHL